MGIERIAVLGAGQMGNGITQVAACAGYEVTMIDIKEEFVGGCDIIREMFETGELMEYMNTNGIDVNLNASE